MKKLFLTLAVAFLVQEVQGRNNKTCVYEYLGNYYVQTVSAYGFCPLSINVGN